MSFQPFQYANKEYYIVMMSIKNTTSLYLDTSNMKMQVFPIFVLHVFFASCITNHLAFTEPDKSPHQAHVTMVKVSVDMLLFNLDYVSYYFYTSILKQLFSFEKFLKELPFKCFSSKKLKTISDFFLKFFISVF